MSKPEINREVYDRYLDASVALFMEHYSAMLTEKISTEGKDEDMPFPEALDLKCKALIKKEASKQKRLTLWKHTKRTLKVAAVFAIAVMTTFSMLFVSVEAFRVQVINFYIENKNGHWSITGNNELYPEEHSSHPVSFNIDNPLKGLIPDEYILTTISNADPQRISATYKNSSEENIYFLTVPYTASLQIDAENADFAKEIKILNFEGVFSIKNGVSQVSWCNHISGVMYFISADNLPETDTVVLAENLAKIINN